MTADAPSAERAVEQESGFDLPIGPYEEARAMIGTRTEVEFATHDVAWPLIKYCCAMVHDGNASYWDEEFARDQWGAVVSPPALLMTWAMAPDWRPGNPRPRPLLAGQVPLPGTTVVSVGCDVEFFHPIRVGDRLNVEEATPPDRRRSSGFRPHRAAAGMGRGGTCLPPHSSARRSARRCAAGEGSGAATSSGPSAAVSWRRAGCASCGPRSTAASAGPWSTTCC
jgi:N-terminal half of MaoC dehydratase